MYEDEPPHNLFNDLLDDINDSENDEDYACEYLDLVNHADQDYNDDDINFDLQENVEYTAPVVSAHELDATLPKHSCDNFTHELHTVGMHIFENVCDSTIGDENMCYDEVFEQDPVNAFPFEMHVPDTGEAAEHCYEYLDGICDDSCFYDDFYPNSC